MINLSASGVSIGFCIGQILLLYTSRLATDTSAAKQRTASVDNENRHQRLDQCHKVVYFRF